MPRTTAQLRTDALAIWRAAVAAVDSERLVRRALRVGHGQLRIGDEAIPLADVRRIAVVGAGKAGAGMAAAVEEVLGRALLAEKQVAGWVNVPADCVRPLAAIHLHPARAAGSNEPSIEGLTGAEEILRTVSQLHADDLCLCLISGGASALLPLPVHGVSLDDKLALTRFLSGAGANIAELNTVRKQLSRIKGGGLARACRAGRLITLIISDVPGDPLDVIGSGPTVPDPSTPADALAVLERFGARQAGVAPAALDWLAQRSSTAVAPIAAQVDHLVIGNNALAVDAAGQEAERRGYTQALSSSRELEGPAEDVGRHLARMAASMRGTPGPDCLITGGEPTVRLVPAAQRGKGGRNQQLVLAAVEAWRRDHQQGAILVSGGTDGEDGPTDAAGAWADAELIAAADRQCLDPGDYLRRNDAYHFFQPLGALLKTGPTHTNVCDVRVLLVDRIEQPAAR